MPGTLHRTRGGQGPRATADRGGGAGRLGVRAERAHGR